MGKFFLGVLTGVAGTVVVTVIGKKLDIKLTRFILDALDTNKPGRIPVTAPKPVPQK